MAAVLEFRSDPRRRKRSERAAPDASAPSPGSCEIVIFPGVRIERRDTEADDAAHDTAGDTDRELPTA